jgi:antitoxin component YwqK of YwqJK toxin-antitoxin module
MATSYKSSIPATARERVVERYSDGQRKKAEYRVGRALVGTRFFYDTGEPEYEYALKDGKRHGIEYQLDERGKVLTAEPFANGVLHGTIRQWSGIGRRRLIGTYRIVRGNGIDLWRQQRSDGSVYLAEVYTLRAGRPHGFEWWLDESQRTVYIERHWRDGQPHGIYREWNGHGRLSRGFPQYHVTGQKVTKRRYLRAAQLDPTLPPFRPKDNRPGRTFPPDIVRHLRLRRKRRGR